MDGQTSENSSKINEIPSMENTESIKMEMESINTDIKNETNENDSKIETTTNVPSEEKETNSSPATTTPTTPDTPELVTRKSSTKSQLSKEERIKRQREARKKKILASSHERLSRITKTYSQSSIHSINSESSATSIEKPKVIENKPFECKFEAMEKNKENKNENIEKCNEPSTKDSNITNTPTKIETISSENENSNEKKPINEKTEKIKEATNDDNDNINDDDITKMVFREILKNEFKNTNEDPNIIPNGAPFANKINPNLNINGVNLPNVDDFLNINNPADLLTNLLGLNNDDGPTTEQQKEADTKYNKYCQICKLIHTIFILVFALVFLYMNLIYASSENDEIIMNKQMNGLSSILYKMSVMDTTNYGSSNYIFGMTPWACFIIFEITLLAIQMGYQYTTDNFKDRKITIKGFNLTPYPIINRIIKLYSQYKLFIEILVNDTCLYLFLIGISISFGKLFY